MKKSIVALGIVLALSGCAAAADETLAAEPAALVEISPATEETAQPVEAAATAEPAQTATPEPTPEPTQAPTPAPTAEPTAVPTAEPTQAPVEETVADTPAQVSMSYGAVPFDLAAGTEQWWSIDSSDSAYWAVQENINAIRAAAGLSPLAMDGGLSAAADARCESFVAGGAFDHSGMTTRSEICAAGPIGSASSVCSYWQNSPAHYVGGSTAHGTALASGQAHGDAALDGAVYDLYAAEDITHPDGVTGVVDYSKIVDTDGNPIWHTTIRDNSGQWVSDYLPVLKKDHLVASAKIENGWLCFSNLYLGKYYVVERSTGVVIPLRDGALAVSGTYPTVDSRIKAATGQTAAFILYAGPR